MQLQILHWMQISDELSLFTQKTQIASDNQNTSNEAKALTLCIRCGVVWWRWRWDVDQQAAGVLLHFHWHQVDSACPINNKRQTSIMPCHLYNVVAVKMLRHPFIFWLYSCKIWLLALIDSPMCTWWLLELFITKTGNQPITRAVFLERQEIWTDRNIW